MSQATHATPHTDTRPPASPRLPFFKLGGQPIQALAAFSEALKQARIGPVLTELVFLRTSQLNGCAYCVDLHWGALSQAGEPPRKLNMVAAWPEASCFSARERAALAWVDALMLAPHPQREAWQDAAFQGLQGLFDDHEITELTLAIANMNAWNRVSVGMRNPVPAA